MMPSFQTMVTLLIVAGAALFLVRRIYRSLKKDDPAPCGCGCSSCNAAQDCGDSQPKETP
jgi:hypothetical protein